MATKEFKFTMDALDRSVHEGGAATRYRDARYPNLYLEVGARSKMWRCRKFWKGLNFTETLGETRRSARPRHHLRRSTRPSQDRD